MNTTRFKAIVSRQTASHRLQSIVLFLVAVLVFGRLCQADGTPLADALNTPTWSWATGGSAGWTVQTSVTHDGASAAQSGLIANSQESWLDTALTNGPGALSFWWKVSSESGYDFIEFYIGGVRQDGRISGEVDWQQKTFSIPGGIQILRWRYVKDGTVSRGQDGAWLDQVSFLPDAPTPPSITTQPLSQTSLSGSNITFSVGAIGSLPLSYEWRFNGTKLSNGNGINGVNSNSLSISNVQGYQVGSYAVVVSNSLGTATSDEATLNLLPPFEVGIWPGYQNRPGYGVRVANGFAYVAHPSDGVAAYDVSNPQNCLKVGVCNTNFYANSLIVHGHYVYAAGSQLYVVDVNEPTHPTLVTTAPIRGFADGAAFDGDHFYFPAGTNGVIIFDASNPPNLVEIGRYGTNATAVAISGTHAYVAGRTLDVVDISNPITPSRLGWWDIFGGGAYGVAVQGNYVYLVSDYSYFSVLDVSNPSNPIRVGYDQTASYPQGIAVNGNYAFVPIYWWGLAIVDITNPTQPRQAAFYDTELGPGSSGAYDVAVSGDYAYLASSYGLQVLDVSNPYAPLRMGGDHSFTSVTMRGNLAFAVDPGSGLQILDVSNPAKPERLGGYDSDGAARSVAISGNYAYLADSDWLDIIDVSIPGKPALAGRYRSSAAYDVAVASGIAYVADYYRGLVILNVTDPSNPVAVATNASIGNPSAVAVNGNYAYLAAGSAGLRIVDVSNPLRPVTVGAYDTPGIAIRLSVSGNLAFVADGTYGLQVIDVSNPAVPVRVGNYAQSPGYVNDVVVRGNRAYLAYDGYSGDPRLGLLVVEISNPTNPVPVGACATKGNAVGLDVSQGYAYVADSSWGLSIIRLSDQVSPATLANTRLANGAITFDVLGTSNAQYIVQRSTTLAKSNWLNAATNVAPFSFTNAILPNSPAMYFKAISGRD